MFKLSRYENEIKKYMTTQNVSAQQATYDFIYNLILMRDELPNFGNEINFRTLGQLWNSLPSQERITQRNQMVSALTMRASSGVM